MNGVIGTLKKEILRTAAALVTVLLGFSTSATAQDSHAWSDIDCAQSAIVAPSGLKCRATQEISGSSSNKGSGNGIFKNWSALGTKDGVKLYYLIYDTVGIKSSKLIYLSLEKEILNLSPYARGGKDFTQPAQMSGADYVRFTSARGEPCVAIRKPGPVQGSGYKWVLFANKCVRAGKQISDGDVGQFISTTGYRG